MDASEHCFYIIPLLLNDVTLSTEEDDKGPRRECEEIIKIYGH
jgi:hypothetical protein